MEYTKSSKEIRSSFLNSFDNRLNAESHVYIPFSEIDLIINCSLPPTGTTLSPILNFMNAIKSLLNRRLFLRIYFSYLRKESETSKCAFEYAVSDYLRIIEMFGINEKKKK